MHLFTRLFCSFLTFVAFATTAGAITSNGPAGLGVTLTPAGLVQPGAPMTAEFLNYTDDTGPILYQVFVDENPVGPVSLSSTISFPAPLTAGPHTFRGKISDYAGYETNVNSNFSVGSVRDDYYFASTSAVSLAVLANDAGSPALLSFTQPTSGGRVLRRGNLLVFRPSLPRLPKVTFTYKLATSLETATVTVLSYPAPARQFAGLAKEPSGEGKGLATVQFSRLGQFTGRLGVNGTSYTFRGSIQPNGIGTGILRTSRATSQAITIQPGPAGEDGVTTLVVQSGPLPGTLQPPTLAATVNIGVSVPVALSPYSPSAPVPPATLAAGTFNMVLQATPPSDQPSEAAVSVGPVGSAPGLAGYAMVKVASNGAVTYLGRSGNAKPFSGASRLMTGSVIPFYAGYGTGLTRPFYSGQITAQAGGQTVDGSVRWKIAPGADPLLNGGVDTTVKAFGDRYTRARTAQGAFGLVSPLLLQLEFRGDVFPNPLGCPATFSTGVTASTSAPLRLLQTTPSNGTFHGFVEPAYGAARVPFNGIILPLRREVYGHVRGPAALGWMQGSVPVSN